jgi:hypothetical protein
MELTPEISKILLYTWEGTDGIVSSTCVGAPAQSVAKETDRKTKTWTRLLAALDPIPRCSERC